MTNYRSKLDNNLISAKAVSTQTAAFSPSGSYYNARLVAECQKAFKKWLVPAIARNQVFVTRKIRTTMSKLEGIPIFTTLLSLLGEKQPFTAQSESYIDIIKVKLLLYFYCRLLRKLWMGAKCWISRGMLMLTWWPFAEVFLALSALVPISHGFFVFSLCQILKNIIYDYHVTI